MADESASAEQASEVHEALHDVQSDIGDMEDGVEELQKAWNAVTMARNHIAEYVQDLDGVEEEEVLVP